MALEPEHGGTPFLIRLFYRTGAFHRPEEFTSRTLPPHVSIYTWSTCTLRQLGLELAENAPSALPSPVTGTRLVFQLVYPDLRRANPAPNSSPRFGVKDMGSIVIGSGFEPDHTTLDAQEHIDQGNQTLEDARFVVGDYVSCAVLPVQDDGSVAPASAVQQAPEPPVSRESRDGPRGFGHHPWEARGGMRGDRIGRGGRNNTHERGFGNVPAGEWRRGEQLPPGRPGRGRGRGRR